MTHKELTAHNARVPQRWQYFFDDSTAQIFAAENLFRFLSGFGKVGLGLRSAAPQTVPPLGFTAYRVAARHFSQPRTTARGYISHFSI